MGCQARFVEMPWARGILSLRKGTLDILPGALKTSAREEFAYFSQPINRSPNVLFMAKAATQKYQFTQLADLIGSDFRLGAQIDVIYGAEYLLTHGGELRHGELAQRPGGERNDRRRHRLHHAA